MHPNAAAVAQAARDAGLSIDVREFPEGTRTAEDAARAIGVDVGQIVKSLVFSVDEEVVIALVSGSNRLDERRLAEVAAPDAAITGKAARADADTARAATGFPIGGVPPFGHATPLRVFVDRDLLDYDEVWAAAGTPRHVFALTPADLVRVSAATPCDLALEG